MRMMYVWRSSDSGITKLVTVDDTFSHKNTIHEAELDGFIALLVMRLMSDERGLKEGAER